MPRKDVINAVQAEALRELLSSRDQLEEFEDGHMKCSFCQDPVTWDNLLAVYLEHHSLKFVCNRNSCMDAARSAAEHRPSQRVA